uniref:PSI domain-containing protein n=1 Tax=Macrostomum lignano TaxID=282301 RepID=A0A1I8HGU0_9PLAT
MNRFLLAITACFLLQQSEKCFAAEASSHYSASANLVRLVKRETSVVPVTTHDNEQYYQITVHHDLNRYNNLIKEFDLAFALPNVVSKTNISSWNVSTDGHEPGPYPQYIAPFMANFGSMTNQSGLDNDTAAESKPVASLTYVATNTSVWVRWANLPLMLGNGTELRLSFQGVIFQNGTMLFQYYDIPSKLSKAVATAKAGVADVFNYEEDVKALSEKVLDIFVHRAENISLEEIVNASIAQVVALPTCGEKKYCNTCMNASLTPTFKCSWCFQRGSCITETQRQLRSWLDYSCHYPSDKKCELDGPSSIADAVTRGVLGFFLALFIAMLVGLIIFVLVYGHRRPDSGIGQCLARIRLQLREKFMGTPRLTSAFYSTSTGSVVRLE